MTLALHTFIQTQRLLVRWGHDAQTVIQALLLPCVFLAALDLVFGKAISNVSRTSALYGTVPMAALVGAVLGSSAAGICLMRERDEGLLARFWVLPVHRVSGPLSRLSAEAVRIFASSVLVMCTGLVMGFRFERGFAAAVAWLAVPVIFGVAFSVVVTMLALRMHNTLLAESTGVVVALLFFFCTGFVPLALYPNWVQPVVAHQPMSYAVDAMRGLSLGGPVLAPMIGTLAWSVGIGAVCTVPMMVGYRKASMR